MLQGWEVSPILHDQKVYTVYLKRSSMCDCVLYEKKTPHTCPCHSMVLMRMMLSGRRSSEIRIWFSWSYTDFLGTFGTIQKQTVWDGLTQANIFSQTYVTNTFAVWYYICDSFTCAMSRESGEHSLSMLLVLSLWALEFCLSFMEVLRGRLCSLFSILLKKGRKTRSSKYMTEQGKWSTVLMLTKHFIGTVEQKHVCSRLHIKTDNLKSLVYKHDDMTLSCAQVSRCSDLQCTWETCGFGTLSCRACQQCR